MFRKDLMNLLVENPMGITQISRLVKESPAQIADDLAHVLRSLKHTVYRARIKPATCRTCGFVFSEDKLNKPSKCPRCHSTWLNEPTVAIQEKPLGLGHGSKKKRHHTVSLK